MAQPIHIIGVPLDLGGNRRGTDMGPSAFRIAGISEHLTRLKRTVVDKGDIATPIPETKGPGDAHKRYVKDIAGSARSCFRPRSPRWRKGRSRSCSAAITASAAGSVAAAAASLRKDGKKLGLIWVDAHGDMNTPGHQRIRQRAWHAAGGAPRARAGGARADRRRRARRV